MTLHLIHAFEVIILPNKRLTAFFHHCSLPIAVPMPVVAEIHAPGTLVTRFWSQSYKSNCLSKTGEKFYDRHTDLVRQYKKNVC